MPCQDCQNLTFRIGTWPAYNFGSQFILSSLLPVESRTKIRLKKIAKTESKNGGGVPKSLKAFSETQKEYAKERKTMNRKQKKLEEKEKYLLKQKKKKEKR